ncbi:MAG: hypothetical protein AAFW46_12385 [Pseudomonadota bacterium]
MSAWKIYFKDGPTFVEGDSGTETFRTVYVVYQGPLVGSLDWISTNFDIVANGALHSKATVGMGKVTIDGKQVFGGSFFLHWEGDDVVEDDVLMQIKLTKARLVDNDNPFGPMEVKVDKSLYGVVHDDDGPNQGKKGDIGELIDGLAEGKKISKEEADDAREQLGVEKDDSEDQHFEFEDFSEPPVDEDADFAPDAEPMEYGGDEHVEPADYYEEPPAEPDAPYEADDTVFDFV